MPKQQGTLAKLERGDGHSLTAWVTYNFTLSSQWLSCGRWSVMNIAWLLLWTLCTWDESRLKQILILRTHTWSTILAVYWKSATLPSKAAIHFTTTYPKSLFTRHYLHIYLEPERPQNPSCLDPATLIHASRSYLYKWSHSGQHGYLCRNCWH